MKKLVSVVATAAMALGLPNSEGAELKFTSQETEIVTDAYWDIKQYWLARGIGVEATKLVLLDEHDKANCGAIGNFPRGMYCTEGKEITITVAAMRTLEKRPSGLRTAATFLVAHELGHAVQDAKQLLKGSRIQVELQANCLAGHAMNAVYPERAAAFDVPDQKPQNTMELFFKVGVRGEDCFSYVPPMKG